MKGIVASNRAKLVKFLIPTLTFILGILLSEAFSKILEPSVQSNSLEFWSIFCFLSLLILIAPICFILFAIYQDVEELSDRAGLKIKYVQRDGNKPDNLYREAINIIRSAKDSINVLTYIPDVPSLADYSSTSHTKIKEEYFSAFLERVKKGGIQYKRILQIKGETVSNKPETPIAELGVDKIALRHYHEILNLKKSIITTPQKVLLLKTPATRMTTFLIVDNRYLIWEIDEVLYEPSLNTRMHGAFIIEDPRKEIIQYFEDFLRDIEYYAAIQRSELPSVDM